MRARCEAFAKRKRKLIPCGMSRQLGATWSFRLNFCCTKDQRGERNASRSGEAANRSVRAQRVSVALWRCPGQHWPGALVPTAILSILPMLSGAGEILSAGVVWPDVRGLTPTPEQSGFEPLPAPAACRGISILAHRTRGARHPNVSAPPSDSSYGSGRAARNGKAPGALAPTASSRHSRAAFSKIIRIDAHCLSRTRVHSASILPARLSDG